MTKSELIKVVSSKYEDFEEALKKEGRSFEKLKTGDKSKAIVDFVLDSIEEALVDGDKVSISGFGIFEVKERAEKICLNPRTQEKITVPAYNAVTFKAGKNLKEAVNDKKD